MYTGSYLGYTTQGVIEVENKKQIEQIGDMLNEAKVAHIASFLNLPMLRNKAAEIMQARFDPIKKPQEFTNTLKYLFENKVFSNYQTVALRILPTNKAVLWRFLARKEYEAFDLPRPVWLSIMERLRQDYSKKAIKATNGGNEPKLKRKR